MYIVERRGDCRIWSQALHLVSHDPLRLILILKSISDLFSLSITIRLWLFHTHTQRNIKSSVTISRRFTEHLFALQRMNHVQFGDTISSPEMPSFHIVKCSEKVQTAFQLHCNYSSESSTLTCCCEQANAPYVCFSNKTRPERQYKINKLHLISK